MATILERAEQVIFAHAGRVVKNIAGRTPANALYKVRSRGCEVYEDLKQLQTQSLEAESTTAQVLSRDIRRDRDEANARQIQAISTQASVLTLKAVTKQNCRWTAMQTTLDPLELSDVDCVGLVVESHSSMISRISLRRRIQNKFRDCFFGTHLVSISRQGTQAEMLDLWHAKKLPLTTGWRDLTVFFSDRDIRLVLNKIRFFTA